jgi:hypothetical protein
MSQPHVTVAVEGDLDAAVARRLLGDAGLSPGAVYGRSGKSRLDRSLDGYNRAARRARWFVLRDLDHDASCAPELMERLLPEPSAQMCFRIVVRKIEAWLLADRRKMAAWLQLPMDVIPGDPEMLADAKATLVQLARRSRSRLLREELVPAAGTHSKVGPGYTGRLIEFATIQWQPQVAALGSPSLARCLRAIACWGAE